MTNTKKRVRWPPLKTGVFTLEKRGRGRPSRYTPELADEIVRRLSDGEPLRQICRDPHIPIWTVIYQWIIKHEDFSIRIAKARELGQEAIAEDCLEIIDKEPEKIISDNGTRYDPAYVAWQKNRVEQRIKLLAKWNPKRYGDRVTMAGDSDNPVAIQADVAIFDALLKNLELKRQNGEE